MRENCTSGDNGGWHPVRGAFYPLSLKMLAEDDPAKWQELQNKTNINGGAIAMGHPVGASGARITMTMMYELMRRGGGKGIASICGGLSQGEAIMISV